MGQILVLASVIFLTLSAASAQSCLNSDLYLPHVLLIFDLRVSFEQFPVDKALKGLYNVSSVTTSTDVVRSS